MNRRKPLSGKEVEAIAEAWNAFKRAFQGCIGPPLSKTWAEMPEPERAMVRQAIVRVFEGATPKEIHEAWCAENQEKARVTGLLQDWENLTARAQHKDRAFVTVVRAMIDAFRATGPGSHE